MKTRAAFEDRPGLHCHCGLLRLLPEGIRFGQAFRLVPCIRCGATMAGRYFGLYIWRS